MAGVQTCAPERRRHVYGRHVGRRITAHLEGLLAGTLPALRLDLSRPPPSPLTDLFSAGTLDTWLEIGFGGGEHLAWQADHNRDIGFIGCEPFVRGVASLLARTQELGLSRLRIHDDDARFALDWLPDASIARVFVLFPDPWPKKRHRKRRLLQDEVLTTLARVMRSGAEFRFATDIADYGEMVLANMTARPEFRSRPGLLRDRPADWPVTRYEEKANQAGRLCRFYSFTRI